VPRLDVVRIETGDNQQFSHCHKRSGLATPF
jgi:hypothetical protein